MRPTRISMLYEELWPALLSKMGVVGVNGIVSTYGRVSVELVDDALTLAITRVNERITSAKDRPKDEPSIIEPPI